MRRRNRIKRWGGKGPGGQLEEVDGSVEEHEERQQKREAAQSSSLVGAAGRPRKRRVYHAMNMGVDALIFGRRREIRGGKGRKTKKVVPWSSKCKAPLTKMILISLSLYSPYPYTTFSALTCRWRVPVATLLPCVPSKVADLAF
jgi:hypothetical protein